MFASAAQTAPQTSATVEPSAAQKLFAGVNALWENLASLDPGEVAVNLGLSIVVIAFALGVWLLRKLLHEGLARLTRRDAPSEATPPRVAGITWALMKAVAAGVGMIVLLSIWGVDLIGWLAGPGSVVLRLAFILLLAVAVVEVTGHVIDRVLGAAARRNGEGRRAAQVRTLRPLARGTIQGFVIVIAGLTALSELGVQIGPLLASAGVLGLALGFGAQTLVKDFLTGLFLIVEDIVAVGDNVKVGDRSGTVEAMTLRTIRVRNMDGTLHILPYSEAQVIDNRTKTFSAYIFDLGVDYATDIENALEVMRRVGDEMKRDAGFSAAILDPLEILGVQALGESVVVLRARFKTRPGEQWRIGREYNRRIKAAFDAAGIELSPPVRKVQIEAAEPAAAEMFGRPADREALPVGRP
jgi:moderate conductance mechanosensitive channel